MNYYNQGLAVYIKHNNYSDGDIFVSVLILILHLSKQITKYNITLIQHYRCHEVLIIMTCAFQFAVVCVLHACTVWSPAGAIEGIYPTTLFIYYLMVQDGHKNSRNQLLWIFMQGAHIENVLYELSYAILFITYTCMLYPIL